MSPPYWQDKYTPTHTHKSSLYRITVYTYGLRLPDAEVLAGLIFMACFAHALEIVPIILAALAYGQDVINLDAWLAFTDSTDRLLN
jgi:hypothetical protein